MPYQYSKKVGSRFTGSTGFHYKGLTFPKYSGNLSRDERRSGYIYFAYFGGKPMSSRSIQYQVDRMIERGLYQPLAA